MNIDMNAGIEYYIANALLRLSGNLGIFAQPSAFADK